MMLTQLYPLFQAVVNFDFDFKKKKFILNYQETI